MRGRDQEPDRPGDDGRRRRALQRARRACRGERVSPPGRSTPSTRRWPPSSAT
ncbi:hypothetical protein [Nocardioides convexus]|uniref:hypothetical protein n=1 Tax=Nocardioides convexus TaxID=2712224 RepID=UPI002418587B|nr:hypothetical protein [Nocardioides convexus]